jgi:hypothetical protein
MMLSNDAAYDLIVEFAMGVLDYVTNIAVVLRGS